MINVIWAAFLIIGIIYAAINGNIDIITKSVITAAESSVTLSFKLIGVMCFWLGLMKIAEKAGIVKTITKILHPIMKHIFRNIPENHPAMGAIIMTISANMLGLGNAVTPLGIKAMQEMQNLNGNKEIATPAMCTFLAICTTGFTIVPATVIALRSAAGSVSPEEIVGVTIVVSLFTTIMVLLFDFLCRIIYYRI
ncbi:MAG: spmA [Massilibacillus sp.]|nr:spmA [Massilibacillus sp.]